MSQVFPQTQPRSGVSPVMWVVAALLAVIAACLLVEVGMSVASARAPVAGAAAGDSVLVVAGQLTRDSYGVYLVDIESRSICVYQWLSGARKLRLAGARTYTYDRQLDEYNTEPSPSEIKKIVSKARRLDEAQPHP